MANLISANERAYFTGVLGDHFDTFKRPIVVFKKPLEQIIITTGETYAGYTETSNTPNITYIPVSGVYDAMVIYKKDEPGGYFQEGRFAVGKNQVRIKVQQAAAEFIQNGTTDGIQIDGMYYNTISDVFIQDYLGLQFYYFLLQKLN